MAKIPKFQNLEEAADFWDKHDFEDYIEDTEPVSIVVKIPRRGSGLRIPLDLKTFAKIRALADKRGVPAEKMVSAWVKEKARAEAKLK